MTMHQAANPFMAILEKIKPERFSDPAPRSCRVEGCEDGWIETQTDFRGGSGEARPCPECKRRAEVERMKARYQAAALPEVLQGHTWPERAGKGRAAVNLDEPYWAEIHRASKDIESIIKNCVNVILLGPVGTGKSQAGALLIGDAIRAGYTALAVNVPDWVGLVMHDYRDTEGDTEHEHIQRLIEPDLLLLDDLGSSTSKSNSVENRLLTRVIAKRYDLQRPTILTSNLKAKGEFSELESAMGFRAFSRVWDSALRLVFSGTNYREQVEAARVAPVVSRIKQN